MAKSGKTNVGGGGGIGSDELTVTKEYVLSGKTYVGADTDDEKEAGTMVNKSGSTTDYSSLDDATGNMGNINALVDLSSGGDNSLKIACTIPKGYHDGESKAFIRLWGVNPANVRAGSPIGYTNNSLKGTFTSDANATAPHILNGYTAYVNGNKITGTMYVQSILSFSAAVYSSTAIAFTWQNPAKGPFSGVIIVGKTGGYPTSVADGTRYYKGAGSNTVASGTSSATVSSFTGGTTYYFRAYSYAIKDNAEWTNTTSFTATAITTKGQQAFTSSGTFTVPTGVRSVDIFCVGGGSSGAGGARDVSDSYAASGGGSGYTSTLKMINVTPGQQFNISIGAGGPAVGQDTYGKRGGSTTVISGGTTIITADGGFSAGWGGGSSGGSAGGRGAWVSSNGGMNAENGASDGGNTSATGQGKSTRAFGEAGNTLYAGGGGGGGNLQYANTARGYGGTGGGGNGADAMGNVGSAGVPGTGSGGGGGYSYASGGGTSYAGGSGICIIRWGY